MVDLLRITNSNTEDEIYSFMGGSQGIISDIDIDSEVMRWAGDLRYLVFGLIRQIFLREYEMKLEVKRTETSPYETIDINQFVCVCF
jgi:diacylglycerol kinase family enzyme